VPSTEQRALSKSRSSKANQDAQGNYGGSKSEFGESMMQKARKNDFAFLTDEAEVREWEAN
jgi:hypothetical protein